MVSSEAFKAAMSLFPSGVTVVSTSGSDGSGYGVTVSSFTSLSLDPCLVLVCLDKRLSGIEHFAEGSRFMVSILGADQAHVSNHFAAAGTDRGIGSGLFENTGEGRYVIRGCLAWIECTLRSTFPGGDHAILIGEVTELSVGSSGLPGNQLPLVYFRGSYRGLSGEPSRIEAAPDRK